MEVSHKKKDVESEDWQIRKWSRINIVFSKEVPNKKSILFYLFGNKEALEHANQWSMVMKDLKGEGWTSASSLVLSSEGHTENKC